MRKQPGNTISRDTVGVSEETTTVPQSVHGESWTITNDSEKIAAIEEKLDLLIEALGLKDKVKELKQIKDTIEKLAE